MQLKKTMRVLGALDNYRGEIKDKSDGITVFPEVLW